MENQKRIKNIFKLRIFCNSAKFENNEIGPNLSPYLNREKINLFCDEVNKLTTDFNNDLQILVKLYLYIDNSFFFFIKGPNFSKLLKLIYNIEIFDNNNKILNLFDLFDIIYIKNLFMFRKFIRYNNWFFWNQLKNSIYSIKNLNLLNEL